MQRAIEVIILYFEKANARNQPAKKNRINDKKNIKQAAII
jgi:hypothetical protein